MTQTAIPSLGDLRAEFDHDMLETAFVQTADYRTLLESAGSRTVVGRRGTGKSALTYRLAKHWLLEKTNVVITIAPEDHDVIAIRPLLKAFGDKFEHVRAGSRLIWRYALVMKIVERLSVRYKASQSISASPEMIEHSKRWAASGTSFFSRFRQTLRTALGSGVAAEDAIAELATQLNTRDLEATVAKALSEANAQCIILIDRLDESYEHDTIGIGFVDGVIYAGSELNARIDGLKTVIFLRDNIFRAIEQKDPDFSRNVEGQTLRLHWDTYQLLNFVANRLRKVFDLTIENDQRVWDRTTANALQHQEGFKKCLQMTLYRPRDLLLLLNHAFRNAARQGRQHIVLDDVQASAKDISTSRLSDLHKEYGIILSGLPNLTTAFAGRSPELTVQDAEGVLQQVIVRDDYSADVQREFALFRTADDQVRNLYSVGFVGIEDKEIGTFVFCHDGRSPDREFRPDDKLLIHPCYWLALNLTRNTLDPEEAEHINDEYDIEVSSQTPELRHRKLGQLISELDRIPLGSGGDSEFEDWSLRAIRVAFAGSLRNVQLHPNKNATQRRDVVGTNLATTGTWKRIYDDYETRQVIFEIKNYEGVGLDEYRQLLSYLCDDYGKLGFMVTREQDVALRRGADLDHFLEMYHKHRVMIIKITGKYLCSILSKLRNPQKHDEPDVLLRKLLDTYSRMYMSGQTDTAAQKRQRRQTKSQQR
jgi:hypothetical protein